MQSEQSQLPHNLKGRDVFAWSYKDKQRSYHCKSCIAIGVVTEGRGYLVDTFWQISGSSSSWDYDEALKILDLKYLGNLNDYNKEPEWKADYYDDSDCLDLNHPNSSEGNFFIRKSANRSAEKMLSDVYHRRDDTARTIKNLTRRMRHYDDIIMLIRAGKTDLDSITI